MRERKTIIIYPQYNSFVLGAFMFERYNYHGSLREMFVTATNRKN